MIRARQPCSACNGSGVVRGTQEQYDEACEACELRARVAYLEGRLAQNGTLKQKPRSCADVVL